MMAPMHPMPMQLERSVNDYAINEIMPGGTSTHPKKWISDQDRDP